MSFQDQDVPQHFMCPITLVVMKDPVIDNEGVSYEREAITQWLSQGNTTSPATGKTLTISDLRPNRALREAIETHLGLEPTTDHHDEPMHTEPIAAPSPMPAEVIDQASSSQTSVELDLSMKYDGSNMLISISPPESTHCIRSSICCVVDISGSMGTEATVQDEHGKTETFGLSVLDVTKHALKTIVKSLTPQDEFSLVTFCSTVNVEMMPRLMTTAAAATALEKIDALQPVDMTNLWGGLKKGLDILTENKPKTDNVALFLLTDGLPNISPGKGEAKSLEAFKGSNKGLPGRIHTFGFGYSMNSVMLSDLSSIGGGCYSFIPDCSFVGTVFVNAIANHITSAAYNLSLEINGKNVTIEKGDHTAYGPQTDDKHLSIQFGSIQYGQPKNVVFPLRKSKNVLSSNSPRLEVTLKYCTGSSKKQTDRVYDWSAPIVENDADIRYHQLRLALVKGIDDTLEASGLNFERSRFVAKELGSKGKQMLSSVEKKMQKLVRENEERSKDLMKDLTGQISEAFSKDEFFFKWGAHFCLSIKVAHLYQFCNNFKDPGVQHYCGELFSDTRDRLDNIFVTLPAPKPSIQRYGSNQARSNSPINMRAFMNIQGGCFLGSSKVHLADQKFKRADKLKKGDRVITGKGVVDEVECVLKTLYKGDEPQNLYKVNDWLVTTAWHPIKDNTNVWKFPAETEAQQISVYTDAVYTFLLKNRGTILIGDTECATLAHGLQGNVIEHEFLGTEVVANDMKRFNSFDTGLVEVYPESFVRDSASGKIVALSRY